MHSPTDEGKTRLERQTSFLLKSAKLMGLQIIAILCYLTLAFFGHHDVAVFFQIAQLECAMCVGLTHIRSFPENVNQYVLPTAGM